MADSKHTRWPVQHSLTSGDGLRDVGEVVLGDEHRVNHVHLRSGEAGWAAGLQGCGHDEHAALHSQRGPPCPAQLLGESPC